MWLVLNFVIMGGSAYYLDNWLPVYEVGWEVEKLVLFKMQDGYYWIAKIEWILEVGDDGFETIYKAEPIIIKWDGEWTGWLLESEIL